MLPGASIADYFAYASALEFLQEVEAKRQAVSRSTSRLLQIARLRHMRSELQYRPHLLGFIGDLGL